MMRVPTKGNKKAGLRAAFFGSVDKCDFVLLPKIYLNLMRLIVRLGFAITGLISLSACRQNQPAAAHDPATWSVSSVRGLLQPGTTDTVRFAAVLDSGWYIYSLTQKSGGPTPMTVAVSPSPPFSLDDSVSGPKPVVIFDKEFGIATERYWGSPAFAAPIAIAQSRQVRSSSLDLKVRYQACNATFCLPARTATLTTPVRIATP